MTARPVTLIGISCDGCDAVLLDRTRHGPAAFGDRIEVRVAHEEMRALRDASLQGPSISLETALEIGSAARLHHWQFPDWSIGDEDGLDFCPGCTRART